MIRPSRSLGCPRPGKILAVDVGGSHVKVMLSSEQGKRKFTSDSKLTAEDMVAKVKRLTKDWRFDAVSIGYPGVVVRNRPVAEPFNLGDGWVGFDFAAAFGCPVKVLNDAAMQAVGSYHGGRMLFLGLGTGLGATMIIDGALEPMELAHLPWKKGKTFEHYLGRKGMKRAGKKKWRKRVAKAVEHLFKALEPDYVVLGGGNAKKVKPLPPKTQRGNNSNAFAGGFRLWTNTAYGGDPSDVQDSLKPDLVDGERIWSDGAALVLLKEGLATSGKK